jgi:hypothetical protein
MDASQIDSFLEYMVLVEEGTHQFSHEQVKKLELICTKVSDLLTKTQAQPIQSNQPNKVQQTVISEHQPQMSMTAERLVSTFDEYVNEMVVKNGSKWQVKDKKGKKVLGTHPSKKKAVAQLQAIEISKHSNK